MGQASKVQVSPSGHNSHMTTSKDFANYCCDLLSSAGPCVAKRMFGGFGISTEGLNIALLVDLGEGDKLWLKADNQSRSRYEAQGCARFTYGTKHGPRSVDYYSAPEEAMDSPDAMRPWAALALECAVRARAGKAPAKPRAKAKPRTTSPKPAAKSPVKVLAPKTPQAKLKTARAATKAVATRATPAKTARPAAPKPQVAKPTVKRAIAPAPKAAAARKSAKGANTAAQ
jgi:DNA transformation protein and related proteins